MLTVRHEDIESVYEAQPLLQPVPDYPPPGGSPEEGESEADNAS